MLRSVLSMTDDCFGLSCSGCQRDRVALSASLCVSSSFFLHVSVCPSWGGGAHPEVKNVQAFFWDRDGMVPAEEGPVSGRLHEDARSPKNTT